MRFPAPLWGMMWGFLLAFGWVMAEGNSVMAETSAQPRPLTSHAGKSAGYSRVKDLWTARDKRLHLVTSAAMVGVGYHLLHDRWLFEARDSRNLAISVTAVAGVIKELYDKRGTPPTCSRKDLVADAVGILVGVFLFTR